MSAPTKAHFILHKSIPIAPLFGITGFDFLLILKYFKNSWNLWKLFAKEKDGGKILLKSGFLGFENSKDENFKK